MKVKSYIHARATEVALRLAMSEAAIDVGSRLHCRSLQLSPAVGMVYAGGTTV